MGRIERQNHDQTARSICKKSSRPSPLSCKCIDSPILENASKIRLLRILHGRRTAKETALEAGFGNGFGHFKFGMTPAQVNELAGNPYDISQLPRAYEYTTDDVRYFWLLVSQVPDFQTFYKGASCLRNRAAGYRDSAGRHDSDYAAFLFHENALIRISLRFEGQTTPDVPIGATCCRNSESATECPSGGPKGSRGSTGRPRTLLCTAPRPAPDRCWISSRANCPARVGGGPKF